MLNLATSFEVEGAFGDHADPARGHYLPERLVLATDGDGAPAFTLLRFAADGAAAEGALLQALLRPGRDPLPPGPLLWQPVPLEELSLRLVVRAPGADERTGRWHPIEPAAENTLSATVHLAPEEVALLLPLLESPPGAIAAEVVEVALRYHYRGLVPGRPIEARAARDPLLSHLRAHLGEAPVPPDAVVHAFLALPAGEILTLKTLAGGEVAFSEDVLRAAARAALAVLFVAVDGGPAARYRLRAGLETEEGGTIAWSLLPPRAEWRKGQLTWSLSDWRAALDESALGHHFPVAAAVAPFQRATVHVVNALPLDEAYLRAVRVDLRMPGPAGVPVHATETFRSDGTVRRVSTHFPALATAFFLDFKVQCTLMPREPGAFPLMWPPEATFRPAARPTTVEVTREAARLDFVDLAADPALFDLCTGIDCWIWAGEAAGSPEGALTRPNLGPGSAAHWVALPGVAPEDALFARCLALPPDGMSGEPISLFEGPVERRRLRFARWHLEPLEPDLVTARLAPEAAAALAFAAVAFRPAGSAPDDEGRLYILDGAESAVHPIWRRSRFDALAYQWRLLFVARDAGGQTLPLATGPWQDGVTGEVAIPLPQPAGPTEGET